MEQREHSKRRLTLLAVLVLAVLAVYAVVLYRTTIWPSRCAPSPRRSPSRPPGA